MTLAILIGVVLFAAFLTLFLVVLPRSSAQGSRRALYARLAEHGRSIAWAKNLDVTTSPAAISSSGRHASRWPSGS